MAALDPSEKKRLTERFAVGYFQGWLGQRKWRWLSGLHFLAVAMGAAVIGYLIGLAIAPLGGGAPIPIAP